MFVLSQTGELINLENAAFISIDENPDGSASVVAKILIHGQGYLRHATLAKCASISEAVNYIYDLANQIGAVLPLPDSESKTTEAKQ